MKQLFILFFSLFFCVQNSVSQGWGQTQKITPDDRALADEFGWSVVIQGDIAAISARSEDGASSDYGAVYIFEKDATDNWIQTQKLRNSDVRQFDRFGQSIDMEGNTMIIGARSQDYDENGGGMFYDSGGAAYIFDRDVNGNWIQTQKLVSSDRGETFQALLGETVAISGDYAVVNAPREITGLDGQPDLTNAGACYIFERDTNGVWSEVQKIVSSERYAEDKFGDFSLAIQGNTIAVGTFRHDFDENEQEEVLSAGAVYIFERDINGIWNEIQKIVVSDREQGEWFGRSVAIEGDLLIVGASNEYLQGNVNTQYGAVYVFERDGNGVYNEIQKIRPNALYHQSKFGHSIDVSGDRLVVGAPQMDIGSVSFGGSAFIFERDTNGIWNQTAIMYDEQVNSGDDFGYNVAISGDFAFVGAYEQDEDSESLNPLSQAGAAYVFNINEPNTLDPLLSIQESTNAIIHVFPNPTNGILNLNLGQTFEHLTIEVHDVLGKKLFDKIYHHVQTIQLNIDVPKGIYLLKATTNNQATSIFKIVKR
ncbi:T9SS type A sorting domain-containing protein [Ichthyenterobacterium sp. W332]|uniref:T9SS type A sorting domain-containing protein n=1 Tax=Microcosmobacter mediterraneus TaxID=3075607 RepID=A0ABU2YGX1_9FLAO|nr:T9SS type A sorting domain-containing protein [Ichthyenterobacterium sp. W332]MDT0557025.1 T9SS type A sorting domain-containing protein [Ichthyenterobacterium sp. W332]